MEQQETPSLVAVERHDRVVVVTLTNERRSNSLTAPMVEQFVAALDAAEADPDVGAIAVTGAGEAFCAGADLRHLVGVSGGDDRAEHGLRSIYAAFRRLHACRVPTIAAVNGASVGAGMNLALVCDVLIAGESALFSTRFMELGLHPGGGHTWLLREAIGHQAANAALLFNENIDGARAVELGLALETVPDDALMARVLALAAQACKGPRGVVERTKDSIREARMFDDYGPAIENEIGKQLWSAEQSEFQSRIAALTQRPPQR